MISRDYILNQVKIALNEDLGQIGDITSALIDSSKKAEAVLKNNQDMILCGVDWVNLVFLQVDPNIEVQWFAKDGDYKCKNSTIFKVTGNARSILIAERTALNFLQMLSGIATQTKIYVDKIKSSKAVVLDTRKTLPGLRLAQKYAVTVGGGYNQRFGLYDAVLIKENHIISSESLGELIRLALKVYKDVTIQVEVETYEQLFDVVNLGVKKVLLDNMSLDDIKKCVRLCKGSVEIEVSGNVDLNNIVEYADTGIDRISIGGLTKNLKAIDLSLRFNLK